MVKIMENPFFLMDDLGGKPTIFGNCPYIGDNRMLESQGCGARFGEAYLETFGPLA